MRSYLLTGISLTLFMVLLVLGAAFLFLFQGRAALEERVDTLSAQALTAQDELDAANEELEAADATRAATGDLLSSAEADAVQLRQQLADEMQRTAELEISVDQLSSDLTAAQQSALQLQEEVRNRPPQLLIIQPQDGDSYLQGETIDLVVAASDAVGVSTVNFSVDQQPLASRPLDDPLLHTIAEPWPADPAGSHTISVTASNSAGFVSEPAIISIEVIGYAEQYASITAEIADDVEQLRGLSLGQMPELTFLRPDEQPQPDVTEDELQGELWALVALDFVAPGYDLAQARADVTAELGPIAHSIEDAKQLLLDNAGAFTPRAQWQFAHNLAHLLQDEQHDLESAVGGSDTDVRLAFQAFYEGEAGLLQELYLDGGHFSEGEVATLVNLESVNASDVLANYPTLLVESHAFPREAGLAFAQVLYQEGGDSFALIDEAWAQPPLSTEQILHPDRYPADPPIFVSLPDLSGALGTDWELVAQNTLGEFRLRHFLAQQLDEASVARAATGWGGDHYAIYWNEVDRSLAMAIRIVWDSIVESAEFAIEFPQYPARLYGANGVVQPSGVECWQGNDVICFVRLGEETTILRAPDLESAGALAESLGIGG